MHKIINLIFFKVLSPFALFLNFKLQFNIPNIKINYDEQNKTSVLEFLTYNKKKCFEKY